MQRCVATSATFSPIEMRNIQKADGNRRPLLLVGEERDALWGGTRISRSQGKQEHRIAELWALSVRDDVNTKIAGSAQTLADYIKEQGGDTVAPTYTPDQPFPLLLKILDADLPLSVQVHPDDLYAEEHAGSLGKSEMWYTLHAEEHAEIIYGMKEGMTAPLFAKAVEEGRTLEGVHTEKIAEGDFYYIPAGLLHALGGGITVAEIQQNSDTTYRIYDYDRTDKNGQKRALHLQDGLAVLRPYGEEELTFARYEAAEEEPSADTLADTNRFRVRITAEDELFCDAAEKYFRCVLALSDLTISGGGTVLEVPRFGAVFVPAGTGAYTVSGHALVADTDCLFEKQ